MVNERGDLNFRDAAAEALMYRWRYEKRTTDICLNPDRRDRNNDYSGSDVSVLLY